MDNNILIDKIINNKYKIVDKLGNGIFGTIYKGINIRNKENIAIKIEEKSKNYKLLKNEAIIYRYLQGCDGVCNLKWFGSDNNNYYMIVDLLGISLKDFIIDKKRKYNIINARPILMKFIIKLAIKILEILKSIHEKGIIHRDIKPDNFLFSLHNYNIINDINDINLYLIDFGLCKKYLNNDNIHLKNRKINGLIGSKNYASMNSHLLNELSRRDDLESIFYVLLYLYDWKLDWENEIKNDNILNKKKYIISNLIKKEYPKFFIKFIEYIRKLEFEEKPNYNYLISLLSNEL